MLISNTNAQVHFGTAANHVESAAFQWLPEVDVNVSEGVQLPFALPPEGSLIANRLNVATFSMCSLVQRQLMPNTRHPVNSQRGRRPT